MSEWALKVESLSKTYRVWNHPFYQLADFLGFSKLPKSTFTENHALVDCSIEVRKGEKLGIIGPNGSGKSTLLKIISNRLRPTSGRVIIGGQVSALLELGSDFHPDFSGRENVLATLAYRNLVGVAALAKLERIIAFSELEGFIDQPVRAYSTGMLMRLTFATATSLEPELLLVDEVLSVGDLYFTHKCLERMRELSESRETTILFVSHNIYQLTFLCERIIWLDKGRVRMSGHGQEVLAAYELAVREEEEKRSGSRAAVPTAGRLGSGLARVESSQVLDRQRVPREVFKRGEDLVIRIHYRVFDKSACPEPVFGVGINREDGLLVSSSIFKLAPTQETGVVELCLPKLLLTRGNYYVSFLLYQMLDTSGYGHKFYTLDEKVSDVCLRALSFKVEGGLGMEASVFSHPFGVKAGDGSSVELLNSVGSDNPRLSILNVFA